MCEETIPLARAVHTLLLGVSLCAGSWGVARAAQDQLFPEVPGAASPGATSVAPEPEPPPPPEVRALIDKFEARWQSVLQSENHATEQLIASQRAILEQKQGEIARAQKSLGSAGTPDEIASWQRLLREVTAELEALVTAQTSDFLLRLRDSGSLRASIQREMLLEVESEMRTLQDRLDQTQRASQENGTRIEHSRKETLDLERQVMSGRQGLAAAEEAYQAGIAQLVEDHQVRAAASQDAIRELARRMLSTDYQEERDRLERQIEDKAREGAALANEKRRELEQLAIRHQSALEARFEALRQLSQRISDENAKVAAAPADIDANDQVAAELSHRLAWMKKVRAALAAR